jgi:cell division transport system permease protein
MEKLFQTKRKENTMNNVWKNLIINIKKEKLLSLSNIFVMTLTFILLGVFIHLVVLSQTAIRMLERQAQITIFFEDAFTEESILDYKGLLLADERILDATYVSKEDAFRIFVDLNKNEPVLLESISASILPASLEVKTKDIADLSLLASEFTAKEGVEEVRFFDDVIERFRYWSNVIYAVGFVLVVIFFVISYAVVLSTLRNTIHSRGVEWEILKLVGASDRYVKAPLIYQGVFFGGLSALIAGGVLMLISLSSDFFGIFPDGISIGFLNNLNMNSLVFSLILSLLLLVSGVVLGYVGSLSAIKKYLKY